MRLLYVHGDDYAALHFQNHYGGQTVDELLKAHHENWEEDNFQVEIIEIVAKPSKQFLGFIRSEIQDYDDSKHSNFWLAGETI